MFLWFCFVVVVLWFCCCCVVVLLLLCCGFVVVVFVVVVLKTSTLAGSNDKDRRTEHSAAEEPAKQNPGPLANSQPPNPSEAELRPSAQGEQKAHAFSEIRSNPLKSTNCTLIDTLARVLPSRHRRIQRRLDGRAYRVLPPSGGEICGLEPKDRRRSTAKEESRLDYTDPG